VIAYGAELVSRVLGPLVKVVRHRSSGDPSLRSG
jgi:hypothetical protein